MPTAPMPAVASPEADFLELRYRADLQLLVARWRRPVSARELRAGYRATLRLARAVGCPFWQVDLRGRNACEAADRAWVATEFLAKAAERLAGPVCLGYLLTPALLAQMGGPIATTNSVAFFAEEGPLTAWLTQCQHCHQGRVAA